jgi:predicted nucleic acid-binding protein
MAGCCRGRIVSRLIQAWDLGPGESSVLAWAYAYPGTEMIVDDLAARRCAAALGIPARGTLGLILTAKKRGRIAAARPILETLRRSGMHLSDPVLNQALALVNEWYFSNSQFMEERSAPSLFYLPH